MQRYYKELSTHLCSDNKGSYKITGRMAALWTGNCTHNLPNMKQVSG